MTHQPRIAATAPTGHWICDCGRKVRGAGKGRLAHTSKVLDPERAAAFEKAGNK